MSFCSWGDSDGSPRPSAMEVITSVSLLVSVVRMLSFALSDPTGANVTRLNS